jgi:hypothetical protein
MRLRYTLPGTYGSTVLRGMTIWRRLTPPPLPPRFDRLSGLRAALLGRHPGGPGTPALGRPEAPQGTGGGSNLGGAHTALIRARAGIWLAVPVGQGRRTAPV